jgi:hypothetical protein
LVPLVCGSLTSSEGPSSDVEAASRFGEIATQTALSEFSSAGLRYHSRLGFPTKIDPGGV